MNAPQDAAAVKKAAFEANKLSKRLHRQLGQAIADFNMIEAGDKVMVCVSGGKDSHALLDLLIGRQQRSTVPYELVAVNLDQKQPGFPEQVLPAYLARRGVAFHIENQDTYSIVKTPGARRPDDVQPVLATAPRHPVPRGQRAGCDQDRARPPPRRHGRHAADEHVLRRPPERHAAQAGQRRRQARRDPPPGLCGRNRPRALGRAARSSRSSRARCAAARTICSGCRPRP